MDFVSSFVSSWNFVSIIEMIFLESWRPWLLCGILFAIAELSNLGTLSWFMSSITSFIITALCFLFPDIFIPFNRIVNWGDYMLQLGLYVVIFSICFFLLYKYLRPIVVRKIFNDKSAVGYQAFIGKQGKALTHLQRKGKVLFEGTVWDAKPNEDSPDIPSGSIVKVVRMEGWVLWVELDKTKA